MDHLNPNRVPPVLPEQRWKDFQKQVLLEMLKDPNGYINTGKFFSKTFPEIAAYLSSHPLRIYDKDIQDKTEQISDALVLAWISTPEKAYQYILERIELTKEEKKLTK